MMRWIVGSSLKFRFLVVAVAAALMYFGTERIRSMPVDVFPEFAPPLVEIQTEGIGMTAAEVEDLITLPLEEQLRGTPELDILRSKSVTGLSAIRLIFKLQTEGFIDTPNQRLALRYVLPVFDAPDLARIPLEGHDGKPVLLGQVAEVKWDTWPMIGDAVINGGQGLMMIVEKLPWANTLDVTRGVDAALAALKPGLPGIEIDAHIFRPATFIELALKNLTSALLIGCLLVILVLGAFLFEWRAALISVVAIPLSLMAGALVLYMRGATINTMILAGFVIAVGVVVDDAIIDIENIVRRLRQHRREGSTRSTPSVILEASLEVRSAIVYATLIDAVALIPVFLMAGLSGAFFRPLALSYALAVLASMVVALTVTPALGLLLLGTAAIERRESPLVRWLQRRYEMLLARIIRTPRPAYVTVAVIVLAGAVVYPWLGQSLLPSFKERDFLMHWVNTPGASLPEMVRIT